MYQQPQASAGDAVAAVASGSQQTQQAAAYVNQYYPASYTPVAAAAAGPIVAPGALSYYAFSGNNVAQASARPGEVSPPPAEPAVTPKVAENAVRKLVTAELKNVGFEKAESMTVKQLELEVQAFVQQLFHRAHEYANLANRAGVIAPDLLKACDEFYVPVNELYAVSKRSKRKRRKTNAARANIILHPPASRSPSPDLLDSDEEGTTPSVPLTLRQLPPHFPSLPPKHTYMKTPISPPKKAALPSLEKKLKTAGLVQKSLQNLLTATEENTNNEDAELLGHIVNWETGLHPRKRWKVGK